MKDKDLYGKYYERAEIHIFWELLADIIISGIVWWLSSNWFYAFVCIMFGFSKLRNSNMKNRQLEILNRLDKIEKQIKLIEENNLEDQK